MPRIIAIPLAVLLGLLLVGALVWGVAHLRYRAALAESRAARAALLAEAPPAESRFDPAMTEGLPEIARRYFAHAIAPGTPLSTTASLRMEGRFDLGTKAAPRLFEMTAQQALHAPEAFVWETRMRSGPVVITGSDGLIGGRAWTRFWVLWSVPVVDSAGTEALDRSAAARPAVESIWAPAALLPANGASWQQTGPDSARVTVATGHHIDLTLGPGGEVRRVETLRWSDANPGGTHQLQPFGGEVLAEARFGGYTIPSEVHVGNLFGTDGYFPFFMARITSAEWR